MVTTMNVRQCLASSISVIVCLSVMGAQVLAAVIAKQDFDGGAMNLVSGFDPATDNLDGGGGDWFGVGSRGAWPQIDGMPFSIADDSIANVSGAGVREIDSEAVFGQALSLTDSFFGISDTPGIGLPGGPPYTASWTFNVAGASNLSLSIDMGGTRPTTRSAVLLPSTLIEFEYQFDSGTSATAFSIAPDPSLSTTYTYRPMDSTFGPITGANGPLVASGANSVTKIAVDTGVAADNRALDKSPPEGTGAGKLDTFRTPLTGMGNQLTLTVTANLPFEAMAFDNIVIEGDGSVVVGVPGDYNDNGAVDAADFVLWRDGGPLLNEGNNPGTVNQADYDFWRARFGATTAGLGTSQVPEPTSVAIGWCAMAFILAARRTAQRRTA